MFQKICVSLNESKSRYRFIVISCDEPTVKTLKELYKEAKMDFEYLEDNEVNIGVSKDGVYKDFLYIFFDLAMPTQDVLEKYFKVKNFN